MIKLICNHIITLNVIRINSEIDQIKYINQPNQAS
jgi:hypothetical protein